MAARLVKVVITSWRMPDGRRVPPRTAGAGKAKTRSRKWYGVGIPGMPPTRRVPLATDKAVSQKLLADLVERGERGQAGMADLQQARRSLTEHAADYHGALIAKGDDEEHARKTLAQIVAIIAGCNFKVAADLNPDAVSKWIAAQRRRTPDPAKNIRPFGTQTGNHYLTAIKGFSAWLAGPARRTTSDPLRHLSRVNAKADRRRTRRALSWDEVEAIVAAAKAGADFRELTGAARGLLYRTASLTGFRAAELASLTPAAFDFRPEAPTVTVAAAYTKNRENVTQRIPAALAAEIREYVADLAADGRLWPGLWYTVAARMLRIDLAGAGVPYMVRGVKGPEYADFHSFRHTFISWLVSTAGATVKQAQTLARHSTPELTIGRYAHTTDAELGGVVGRLPGRALPAAPPEVERLRQRVAELEAEVERLTAEKQTGGQATSHS